MKCLGSERELCLSSVMGFLSISLPPQIALIFVFPTFFLRLHCPCIRKHKNCETHILQDILLFLEQQDHSAALIYNNLNYAQQCIVTYLHTHNCKRFCSH